MHERSLMNKKYIPIIYVFFLLFLPNIPITIPDFSLSIDDDDDGAYVPDIYDDWADQDVGWQPGTIRPPGATQISPAELLDLLTCPGLNIFLQNRLPQNFYIFTNPQNKRSILDQPQFLVHLSSFPEAPQSWQFNFWMFYNQTSLGNYTKNKTDVASYLNIYNTVLFGGLNELINNFVQLPFDIPTLQQLFGLLKLQQRTSGYMFDFYKEAGPWNFEWKIPLLYFERNFFVTPAEQARIEAILQFESDGSFNHLVVSDQLGVGDSRVNIGYHAVTKEWIDVNVGLELTLPTAFPFKKGLIGSNFAQNSTTPPFDLLSLAQLALNNQALDAAEIAIAFGLSAANKLAANLLQTGIGDDGHVGVGGFVEQELSLNQRFTLKTRADLEYRFPNAENRFFITKKYAQAFTALEPYCGLTDQKEALDKLQFLNEQLILTFIPRVYRTSIYPGFIFKFQSAIVGSFGRNWQFGLGLDLWWQSQEKFGGIKASPEQIAQINIPLAQRSMAYQNKFFGSINYRKRRKKGTAWSCTLYGDYSFLSTGLGQDFNISMQFSFDY